MNGDNALHVLHCPITQLEGVPIANFVEFVVAGDAFLHNLKEVGSNISFHIK